MFKTAQMAEIHCAPYLRSIKSSAPGSSAASASNYTLVVTGVIDRLII
jgi:hypothetical protein